MQASAMLLQAPTITVTRRPRVSPPQPTYKRVYYVDSPLLESRGWLPISSCHNVDDLARAMIRQAMLQVGVKDDTGLQRFVLSRDTSFDEQTARVAWRLGYSVKPDETDVMFEETAMFHDDDQPIGEPITLPMIHHAILCICLPAVDRSALHTVDDWYEHVVLPRMSVCTFNAKTRGPLPPGTLPCDQYATSEVDKAKRRVAFKERCMQLACKYHAGELVIA